jgi:hypothetical protein
MRAIELFREAAELGCPSSMYYRGELAFGELDEERYQWWDRAAQRGCASMCFEAILSLIPVLERGEISWILHPAKVVGRDLKVATNVPNVVYGEKVMKLRRLLAMVSRAREAIMCWSIVGRRRGVVKDIRIMIAKIAWTEDWRWSETAIAEQAKKQKMSLDI